MWIRNVHILFVVLGGKPVHCLTVDAIPMLTMKQSPPHIGHLIRDELRRQRKTNVWLAQQLCVNPRTVNKIFEKEYIDTFQLFQISQSLRVDFFHCFSESLGLLPDMGKMPISGMVEDPPSE